MVRPTVPAVLRALVAALKRLDTLFVAGIGGVCAGALAQSRLCGDLCCRSLQDSAIYWTIANAGGVGLGVLFWRYARRWWSRALLVPASLYALLVLPPALWAHGRWSATRSDGSQCAIDAGMTSYEVHAACGDPTQRFEGAKFLQAGNRWNPFDFIGCGYVGEAYGDRIVTYDCRGRVATVVTSTRVLRISPPGCDG
jgi:hypothetical protein